MSSAINLQQISSRSSAHLLKHLCKKIIDVKVFFEKYVKILSIHFNNTLDMISLGLSILISQGGYNKCTLSSSAKKRITIRKARHGVCWVLETDGREGGYLVHSSGGDVSCTDTVAPKW